MNVKSTMRNPFAILGLLLLTTITASAELVWERKDIHIKATPLEKELVAVYPFRNDGNETVKFKSFKSTCDCVSITASTMVVPPGAKGDVTVRFQPEYRLGEQKRPIAVQFDDANQTRIALYLRVEIPEIIRTEPIFLRWGPDETIDAKSVTIVTDGKYPVEKVTARALNPHWSAKVVPIENSRNYTLQVLPKRSATPQAQYVEVEATLADGQTKRTNLYVVVR
jgi:hypothetical protein